MSTSSDVTPPAVEIARQVAAANSPVFEFPNWVVFNETTTDYPGQHVVRRFAITSTGGIKADLHPAAVGTYAECVAAIPRGLVKFLPSPHDPPQIKEIWL